MGCPISFFDVPRRCLQAHGRLEISRTYRCYGHASLHSYSSSLQADLFSATRFASGSLHTGGETWR